MKKILFVLLLVALSVSGCGKGKSGAILKVTTSTPLTTPSSKAGLSKLLLAARGDGEGDQFPDVLLTPSAFTIALKSFKIVQTDTTTIGLGQALKSYTLFDVGFDAPKIIELNTGTVIDVAEQSNDPPAGTYNRIEYEVSYIEMMIPLCDVSNVCEDRRLRFYLNNFSATAFDLLLSQSTKGFDFGWISAAQGLPLLIPITNLRPLDPVQIPSSQFETTPPSPLFSLALPPVTIPTKPDGKFIFTLDFNLADLFFFDNTDQNTIDRAEPFHFNALVDNDLTTSADGKVRRVCGINVTVPCPAQEANFWPGLPTVTPSASQETPQNQTTTTTTVIGKPFPLSAHSQLQNK
jgi:hypothetical protein